MSETTTSKTPLTDSKASGIIGFFSCETVPANTCRAIEERLNKAVAENDRLAMICQSAHDRLLRGDSDGQISDILAASWKDKP